MKYYVFTKSKFDNFDNRIFTKKIYNTTEYDLACIRYDTMMNELRSSEVLFMVADFGLCKDNKSLIKISYAKPNCMYLPFFVIKCSDDNYFNYDKCYGMKDVKIGLINDGIQQMWSDPSLAFDKYHYYKKNRISATMIIEYRTIENHNVPVSTIESILWKENTDYMYSFALGIAPEVLVINFGPFKIKKKIE